MLYERSTQWQYTLLSEGEVIKYTRAICHNTVAYVCLHYIRVYACERAVHLFGRPHRERPRCIPTSNKKFQASAFF